MTRTAAVTAVFGTPLAASAASDGNMLLTTPLGLPLPASVTASGDSLRLVPKTALPGDTNYILLIKTGLTDTAGRKLAAPVLTTFTTAPQAWDATVSIIDALPKSIDPYMSPSTVVDAAGNVTVTWQRDRFSTSIHWARLDVATGVWSAPRVLYELYGSSVQKERLVAAPGGDLDQFWFEYVDVGGGVFQRHLRQSHFDHVTSIWSAPKTVKLLPQGHLINTVEIVGDTEGRLTALMTNSSIGGEAGLYAARLDRTSGAWTAAVRVDGPGQLAGSVNRLAAATDRAGNVLALWERGLNGLVSARFDVAAARWSTPVQLSGSTSSILRPSSLSINPAGMAVASWSEKEAADKPHIIKAATFDPASLSWSAPLRIDKSFTGAAVPMVVLDVAGNITMTWHQADGIYASRYEVNVRRWSTPLGVSTGPTLFVGERAMAVDVAGNVTLLVTEDRVVKAMRHGISSQSWSAKTRLAVFAGSSESTTHLPSLAIDQAGDVTAAWFMRHETAVTVYTNELVATRLR